MTPSIEPGSRPRRLSATSDDAPQSKSTCVSVERTEIHAWKRPPLPNASPDPTNCTVTLLILQSPCTPSWVGSRMSSAYACGTAPHPRHPVARSPVKEPDERVDRRRHHRV